MGIVELGFVKGETGRSWTVLAGTVTGLESVFGELSRWLDEEVGRETRCTSSAKLILEALGEVLPDCWLGVGLVMPTWRGLKASSTDPSRPLVSFTSVQRIGTAQPSAIRGPIFKIAINASLRRDLICHQRSLICIHSMCKGYVAVISNMLRRWSKEEKQRWRDSSQG